MSVFKSSALRWGVVLLCLLLGTWCGMFLQHITATSLLVANFVDVGFNIKELDLAMLKFGLLFALKINLGTVIGGVIGLWLSR